MAELTLHHLHHEASDVDAAAQFYVDNFGGVVTERVEKQGVQCAHLAKLLT